LLVALLASLAAALILPVRAAPAGVSERTALARLDTGVLSRLNQIRLLHGLSPLRMNAELNASAAEHSREMGADGYFEHASANGTAFWRRIAEWYGSTGYDYWSVGENLLWSSPNVDPTEAVRLWMNSPPHRRNILDPHWREIGIAAVHVAGAPGAYHGLPVTIITTDFGVRR
jgi:uncharacterized protein YkwD